MSAITQKPESKSAIITKLLRRPNGATLQNLTDATGWKPHSARAFLSTMRKKGIDIVREKRKTGESAYRIAKA